MPSVPNVLGRASTYDELRALAAAGGVGDDLVVQTPYGDSGQTTFFIASQADWDEHAVDMAREELKVMRRINCREAAIEGVITRHGTLVGPLMAELAGFPELTPYGGGWCGNDVLVDRPHRPPPRDRARAHPRHGRPARAPRATAATSSSTSSPTSTPARCTSASSTRG